MNRSLVVVAVAVSTIAFSTPAAAQRDRTIVVQLPQSLQGESPTGISDVAGSSGQYQTLTSELVSAELRNDVNFFLDLGSNKALSPRDICVNLNVPVGDATPRARPCADMHWNTSDAGSLSAMPPGAHQNKRMQLYWTDSQGTYYLRWGSSDSIANWVTVTCDDGDTAGCFAWTISNPNARVARLTLSTRKALLQLGDYDVPVDLKVVAR